MQTVDKAMKLLSYFTPARPEIGLSDLARLAGYDKAATRRFLVALLKHAFIEQNPANRRYRLGAAFLHFAQVREATLPLSSVITPLLEALTEVTGETAHASHYSAGALVTIGKCEPSRATRVHLDPAEVLPLHATASGLTYLAYGPEGRLDEAIDAGLRRFTSHTVVKPKALREAVDMVRSAGFAVCDQGYEEDVTGIAMPFFDASGVATGAIGVATPTSRLKPDLARRIERELFAASRAATEAIGGVASDAFLAAHRQRQAA